ncbi:hypothetical protein [Lewinella sp. IMCC34191]|uniref:hypothetical protein n=1 Tax=Lewinella sp. IMCC34191 TaxID=2259172 RepID=UPI000E2312C1|nr:hypothetical protein [Lewinella sp. IMCC34191]
MSNLEDRIRESHRRTFPVTPPEGGWERIHQDLNRPENENRPKSLFGWGFLSGLLAGGLAVYLLLSINGGSPSTPPMATAPCPEASVPERTTLAAAAQNEEPPTEHVGGVLKTSPPPASHGYAEQEEKTPDLRDGAPLSADSKPLGTLRTSEDQAEENSEVVRSTSPLDPRRVTPAVPTASMLYPVQPITSRSSVNFTSRLPVPAMSFTPATDTPQPERKWTFHRVPKEVQMSPRWEVGGSLLVVPTRQRYIAYALEQEPTQPNQQMRIISSGNGPDTLYVGGMTGFAKQTYAFNFRSIFLEVGHQFPNGIRLSGGLLGIVSGTENYQKLSGVFEELHAPNEATLIRTRSDRRLIGTLSIQYTFFRRRRFRVSAGLGITSFLSTRDAQTSFIALGDDLPSGSQTSFQHNNLPFFRTTPLPSLQFQYQISRYLSLTGDLMPGLGIGLRYGIESSAE